MSETVRGQCVGTFDAGPGLEAGHSLEVFQYVPSDLVLSPAERAAYYSSDNAPAYNSIALDIAQSLGATYGPDVHHTELAASIAHSSGAYYAVRLLGARHEDGMVACAYTENTDPGSPIWLVNALEIRRTDVNTPRGRYEASLALHCMFRRVGEETLVLFRRRVNGEETRDGFFRELGVQKLRSASSLGFQDVAGWAAVGTIRQRLAMAYDLTWADDRLAA